MDIGNINSTQRSMLPETGEQLKFPSFPEPPTQLQHYDDSHPVVQENMAVRRGIIEGTDRTGSSGRELPLDSAMVDLLARSTVPADHLRNIRGHSLKQTGQPNGTTYATYNYVTSHKGINTFKLEGVREDRRDWINSTDPKDTQSGKVAVMTHELGHLQQFSKRDNPRMEASRGARFPYLEGHAEGYAQHYTPKQEIPLPEEMGGSFVKQYDGLYKTSQFEDAPHGPELFMAAKQHAYNTGDPGSIKTVDDAYDLSDVLIGRHSGGPMTENERRDATHRMLINHIQRESGVEQGERDYEDETQQRNIAVHGQTIQGSMFPDIVPETNQFGSAPLLGPAEVHRSRIGRNKANAEKNRVDQSFERLRNMES